MAKIEDIDVAALARKYLGRPAVADRDVEAPDQSTEVGALLEAAAVAFLLYPQAVLSFVLRAKNGVQQLVTSEIALLDYMLATFLDLGNPDGPMTDTSDLVEAQTALLELDRLGRLDTATQAYSRYSAAVGRFLTKAGPFVKRNARNELERSHLEAVQDLYSSLANFLALHPLVISRLDLLVAAVDNFNGIDLTKIVATRTLSRVRSSLSQVQTGVDANNLSKSVAVLELLAGSSSLQSISRSGGVYDPAVATAQKLPGGRVITAAAEDVRANVVNTDGPWVLRGHADPWYFCLTLDGGSQQNIQVPAPGVLDQRLYLKSTAPGQLVYDTSVLYKLYVSVNGTQYTVALTSGAAVPIATIISDINTALSAYGVTCAELVVGSGRLLLVGNGTVTALYVKPVGQGSYSGGDYVPADPSAHEILRLPSNQNSVGGAGLNSAELADLLLLNGLAAEQELAHLRISSPTHRTGSISLPVPASAGISYCVNDLLGFSAGTYGVAPSYLTLQENGADLDPAALGVYVGSEVTGGGLTAAPVTGISGNRLQFSTTPPSGTGMSVLINTSVVRVIRDLLAALAPLAPGLAPYQLKMQTVLTPVLARPTQATLNDAADVMSSLRALLANMQALLAAAVVTTDQMKFEKVSQDIRKGLEERNLDLALAHLMQGNFSGFFGLSPSTASAGGNMLLQSELIGRSLLPASTLDYDQDEERSIPAGTIINSELEMEPEYGD